jgi:gluconate 2-dehydrogenase gamma chain
MRRASATFSAATPAQRAELLDQIAYQKNRSNGLNPGIDFFILARRMTVDGFYTSAVGMRDIYQGNSPRTEFTVPAEAYEYVLSRSPFK